MGASKGKGGAPPKKDQPKPVFIAKTSEENKGGLDDFTETKPRYQKKQAPEAEAPAEKLPEPVPAKSTPSAAADTSEQKKKAKAKHEEAPVIAPVDTKPTNKIEEVPISQPKEEIAQIEQPPKEKKPKKKRAAKPEKVAD